MKSIVTFAVFFTLCLVSTNTRAQNAAGTEPAATAHFYRLHFVVKEVDGAGKVINARSYDETISTHGPGDQQIKTGSRVPIATGSYGSNANVNAALMNTQFQYIDLGVNLDVRDVSEHNDMLGFRLKAEVSSIARQTEVAGVGEPVIRQNSWDSTVAIPIGKATVVGSSDDLDSKGMMQVEVTATRVE